MFTFPIGFFQAAETGILFALNSANLNGTSQAFSVASNASLNPTDITVSIWIKLNTANGGDGATNQLILNRNARYSLEFDTVGNMRFNNFFAGALSYNFTSSGVWTLITGTINGSSAVLYENGIQKDTGTIDRSAAIDGDFFIGKRETSANWFDGLMSYVKVYDRALSVSEVLELYNSGNPVCYDDLSVGILSGLVSAWTLSNFEGNTGSELLDQTSSNDLTNVGSTPFTGTGLTVDCTPVGEGRLYHCDNNTDKIYELDIDTLLDISSGGVTAPSTLLTGLGGIATRLYHCDNISDKLYELDPDTLLDISSGGVTSPSVLPTGIGGTSTRLYHCDADADKLYELDPDTLLDISSGGVTSPSSFPFGIGGTSTRLYHCDLVSPKIYELDPDTLLDISSGGVTSPSTGPEGIGGISTRLYHCDNVSDKLYELDPDTLLDISSGGVTSPSTEPRGIGGIKTS